MICPLQFVPRNHSQNSSQEFVPRVHPQFCPRVDPKSTTLEFFSRDCPRVHPQRLSSVFVPKSSSPQLIPRLLPLNFLQKLHPQRSSPEFVPEVYSQSLSLGIQPCDFWSPSTLSGAKVLDKRLPFNIYEKYSQSPPPRFYQERGQELSALKKIRQFASVCA